MRKLDDQSRQPILLTTSFNCVDYEQSAYFKQRETWAAKNDLDHVYVTENTTGLTLDAHASAWLRLPLMKALQGRRIIYVDHDCLVAEDTPVPDLVTGGLDELFVARGHSGRPNSGVLIVSSNGSEIFDFCIKRIAEAVPLAYSAPYENGHVIWACTVCPWRPLPWWMNDTRGTDGKVIHHTGPNHHLRSLQYLTDADRKFDFSVSTLTSPTRVFAMAEAALRRLSI